MAMPRMLKWLDANPQAGLLHYHLVAGSPISPSVVQYWRSFEDLDRFARGRDAPHLAAWKRFNAQIGSSGDVGIWHETYKVRAGEFEAMFGNVPSRRLGVAGALQPIGSTAAAQTAAQRIGARGPEEDRPPVEDRGDQGWWAAA